ncbi:MAG: hypothetical protein U1A77_18590 [Pirellulales bacterium]
MPFLYRILADGIVVFHAAYVLWVILGPKQAHACRDFRRRGARTQRADPQPSEPKSVA